MAQPKYTTTTTTANGGGNSNIIIVNQKNIEEKRYLGIAIHSQVRRIKQEIEETEHTSPYQQSPEICWPTGITGSRRHQQQRSPSPLGLATRPITGNLDLISRPKKESR
ncbi:uncharacterized protein LOC124944479 [Impatiens glandulifera]|uniref:uncharacterized protein LOC124944479 n=1 Tax=Impatiens glandulifera TaxID=253017 RepID=UPI001FB14B60|nr:uncharacterized protein LOC124944479 [Impatiens glandulifera]